MKSSLLAAIVLICATNSIINMENQKAHLYFLLNHEWQIKGSLAQNMEYEVEPSEFLGKKITEAVPLSDHDGIAIRKAIINATQNQKSEKVEYVLNNKKFSGTITPIIKENEQYNFFLKVQENEDC